MAGLLFEKCYSVTAFLIHISWPVDNDDQY